MKPRSLIVTSAQHGELGLAISFVRGQALAAGARLQVPAALRAVHAKALPAETSSYTCLEDIAALVESYAPDVLLVFSAYMLARDGLATDQAVDALLRTVRDRGCVVVTSDPWLGLARRLKWTQIDRSMVIARRNAQHPLLAWLEARFRRAPRTPVVDLPILEATTHLYPTSIPACDDETPRVSFFNPASVREAGRPTARPDRSPERPEWLFVLSPDDVHVQSREVGLAEFTTYLFALLRHALAADRHAVLVAPPRISRRVKMALGGAVEVMMPCPFRVLEARLLGAEYVFSWNAFSFVNFVRVVNGLSVFSFDRGYTARILQPYYDLAVQSHLGGREPKYLDQRQLFSGYVLAHLAKTQVADLEEVRAAWRTSPTPDDILDRLVS